MMKKHEIKAAVDRAAHAHMPKAIKEQGEYKAREAVRDAMAPPPPVGGHDVDSDSGEYGPVAAPPVVDRNSSARAFPIHRIGPSKSR